ncbi:MAG: helix-turn-helix transcriptional regulator [Burkholderiales bacterium]|nr:helix-turn-helix transcriptional regulator [Burkholderiales bacterium]
MDTRAAPAATPGPIDRDAAGVPENPVDGDPSRAVVLRRSTYVDGHHIAPHWHARAQFVYAVSGTMRVRTPRCAWIVPPSRALWVPARTAHEIRMHGVVEMRSLYVAAEAATGMPGTCVVLDVTPLMRELVVRAAALPGNYDEAGDEGLLMRVVLAEIRRLPRCALDLPLPASPDLVRLCEELVAAFSTGRAEAARAGAAGASARTLYRRFLRETGISFARWKQQARLLESIRRLAGGAPVTAVALELGYGSPSAFSAMFRRLLGAAPREFVASVMASQSRAGIH